MFDARKWGCRATPSRDGVVAVEELGDFGKFFAKDAALD